MQGNFYDVRFPRLTIVSGGFSLLTSWENAVPVRPHWRVWWNQGRGAAIGYGDNVYELRPNRTVIVPPHVRIRHILHKPVFSLAIHVEISEPVNPDLDEVFHLAIPAALQERLRYLAGSQALNDERPRVRQSLFLGEALCGLLQLLPDRVWTVVQRDPRVEVCLQAMQALEVSECTNERLAQAACMSKNAFIRLFSQTMGTSPQAYLQRLRLDKAASMLTQSDEPIDEVAERCGFCDRNYLSKLFKRRFGVGPASYRRQGG